MIQAKLSEHVFIPFPMKIRYVHPYFSQVIVQHKKFPLNIAFQFTFCFYKFPFIFWQQIFPYVLIQAKLSELVFIPFPMKIRYVHPHFSQVIVQHKKFRLKISFQFYILLLQVSFYIFATNFLLSFDSG